MLRARDFGHFCPEGEVGRVESASFSDLKRFSLGILPHFGRFHCPAWTRREGLARREIDDGD